MIKKLNTKSIIKTFLIIMNLLLLSFLSYATVSSENINKDSNIIITYNFDNPKIEKIIIGDNSYDRVQISETISTGKPNEPCY